MLKIASKILTWLGCRPLQEKNIAPPTLHGIEKYIFFLRYLHLFISVGMRPLQQPEVQIQRKNIPKFPTWRSPTSLSLPSKTKFMQGWHFPLQLFSIMNKAAGSRFPVCKGMSRARLASDKIQLQWHDPSPCKGSIWKLCSLRAPQKRSLVTLKINIPKIFLSSELLKTW